MVEESGQLGNRCTNHSLTVGVKDGVLNVLVYSMEMTAITGNSGEVASFKLKLGNQPKTIELTPSNVIITNSEGTTVSSSTQNGNVTIRCAKAEYSTTEVDFGEVPIQGTYEQKITVTNVGNADLNIDGLVFSDVNVFSSTTTMPLTIGAGESNDLNITYKPVERGSITKTMKVTCNSSSKQNTIQLKAQPFAVNELHVQPVSGVSDEEVTIAMTMNNMDAISGLQIEFTMPEQLEYIDDSFTLSDRKQDHTAVVSLNENTLRIIAYSPNDKPFTGDDGEIGSFKVKLVGRNGLTLTPSKTVLSATINNQVTNVVSDVFGGEVTIQSPTISTDDALDFGEVSITQSCEKLFKIYNYGSSPLTINRIVFNDENLSIKETLPIVIPVSDNSNVTVVYSSVEQKSFAAKMQIYSNDPDQRLKEIDVTGSRIAPNYFAINAENVFPQENLSIDIALDTYDEIMGLQFDLVYPGQYYETFDNNYTVEERAEGMTVTTRQIDDNTLRVFGYFLAGSSISAGTGKIMSLLLKPKTDISIPQDTYQISAKDIKLSTEDLEDKFAGSDTQCSFKVLDGSPITITAKSYSREYGSADPTFEYETAGAELYGVPDITCEATETSPVGTYPIVVTKGSVENVEVTFVNGTLTITAKTVESPTITLSQTSYTYDGSEKKPAVTVKDGEITIPSEEYIISYSNNTNVGTATVTITDKTGGNYNVSGSTTFAISAADGSLTPPIGKTGLIYTGSAQDLVTAGSTTTGTLQYSLDGTNYGTTIPQGTDAKEYTVYYRVKGDANHKDITAKSFKVTIAKAPLKITAKNYTRKQGEANPDFGVTYEGFKNNETDAVLTTKPTVTCAATKDSPAGTYDITVSGAVAGNYEISYVAGKLTVEAVTPPTPMPEPKVTTFDEDVDNSASNKVIITFVVKENDSSGTPTVAVSDDKDATGSVSIPETVTHNGVEYKVTEIGEGAFQNNTGLTEVTIPASITSIGAKAFAGCKNLQSITVNIIVPINLSVVGARGFTRAEGSDVFEGVDKETCILYVPEGSVDAYKAAPVWKEFKNILAIGTTGINGIVVSHGESFDVFTLSGLKVKSKATSLDGLPKGIYVVKGKKIMK